MVLGSLQLFVECVILNNILNGSSQHGMLPSSWFSKPVKCVDGFHHIGEAIATTSTTTRRLQSRQCQEGYDERQCNRTDTHNREKDNVTFHTLDSPAFCTTSRSTANSTTTQSGMWGWVITCVEVVPSSSLMCGNTADAHSRHGFRDETSKRKKKKTALVSKRTVAITANEVFNMLMQISREEISFNSGGWHAFRKNYCSFSR